jgi:hypothetical protein
MKKSTIETGCEGPARHPEHLCTLMEQGRSREVAERSGTPRFSCRNCSALADRAEDLCRPQALDLA